MKNIIVPDFISMIKSKQYKIKLLSCPKCGGSNELEYIGPPSYDYGIVSHWITGCDLCHGEKQFHSIKFNNINESNIEFLYERRFNKNYFGGKAETLEFNCSEFFGHNIFWSGYNMFNFCFEDKLKNKFKFSSAYGYNINLEKVDFFPDNIEEFSEKLCDELEKLHKLNLFKL